MNFRLPRAHLEKVAIFDFELVARLAVRTIDPETARPQPSQGCFIRFDAGLDDVPTIGTSENESPQNGLLERPVRRIQ
jgi:hypothetical protein